MILGINSFLYIFECHRCGILYLYCRILYKYSAHPQVSSPHFISEGKTEGVPLSLLLLLQTQGCCLETVAAKCKKASCCNYEEM